MDTSRNSFLLNHQVLNPNINSELDKVIPVNPLTGLRDDILHKYEIALTDSERANISQYLQAQETVNQGSVQLSDDDLVALCPSRYLSTISDMRSLVYSMRQVVSDLDKSNPLESPKTPAVPNNSSK